MRKIMDIGEFVNVLTPEKVNKNLIERFKKRRKETKLSQKKLAEISGVSYGSIRRFESTGEISLKSLLYLAYKINCLQDFEELFKYEIITKIKED